MLANGPKNCIIWWIKHTETANSRLIMTLLNSVYAVHLSITDDRTLQSCQLITTVPPHQFPCSSHLDSILTPSSIDFLKTKHKYVKYTFWISKGSYTYNVIPRGGRGLAQVVSTVRLRPFAALAAVLGPKIHLLCHMSRWHECTLLMTWPTIANFNVE